MGVPWEEAIGKENMQPEAKEKVIELLRSLQAFESERRYYYSQWCKQVGVAVRMDDLKRLDTAWYPGRS